MKSIEDEDDKSRAKRHDNKQKAQQTAKNEEADTKEVSRNLRRSPRLNSTTASVTTGPPKSEQDYFHAISLINSVAGNEPWTGACDGGLDAAALEVVFPSPAGMAQGAQGALGHPQAKEETTTPTSDPGFLGPTPTLRAGAARGRPQPRGRGPSQQASPKEVRGSAWSRGKGGHRRPSPGLHQHAAAPYHLGTRAAARTGAATESERSSKTQASHAGGSEPPGASRGSRSPS